MSIKLFHKQEIQQAIATGLLIEILGDKLEDFVSIANNSIPTAGSNTAPINKLDIDQLFIYMTDIILHKTGDFTIKTDVCNVRFWAKEDSKLLYLAHATKKQVYNKIVDEKYNCGDLLHEQCN